MKTHECSKCYDFFRQRNDVKMTGHPRLFSELHESIILLLSLFSPHTKARPFTIDWLAPDYSEKKLAPQ